MRLPRVLQGHCPGALCTGLFLPLPLPRGTLPSRRQEQACLRGCEASGSPGDEFSISASRALPQTAHTRLTRSRVRATGFAPRSPVLIPCCFTGQKNLRKLPDLSQPQFLICKMDIIPVQETSRSVCEESREERVLQNQNVLHKSSLSTDASQLMLV